VQLAHEYGCSKRPRPWTLRGSSGRCSGRARSSSRSLSGWSANS